ncbi:MAG: hypothetical protein BWK76_09350 [Desulfobulbaceae bacterium A2]|nr:MAG: hypothetical protein BWK76_09350 [Desulfobulbaceae bacterium A2]
MSWSRITFLNPPFLKKYSRSQRSPAVTKSCTIYYPLWLSTAAGYVEQCGHRIDLIDAPAAGMEKDDVLARVRDFAPRLLVVETSTASIYNDATFCDTLKQVVPEATIVLVGTHVSALPEDSMRLSRNVDAVAIGEYDETIREIADTLAAGGELAGIAGLCYWDGQVPRRNVARELLADLDRVPMVSKVYKRFLQPEHYFNPNALFPMVTITTSRGCPHHCIFCVYPQTMMGHRLRLRSVEHVADELEYIAEAFPSVKSVFFEDDTFPANKKRCIAICEEMLRRRIRLSWTANARVDVDRETLAVMRQAGCRSLCVGFESGSQQLLDNIKKRITLEQSLSFMAAARQLGILVHGCFIVGLPGETGETMEATLRFATALRPDTVQFYPVMVYPGTEAYRWYAERNLLLTEDFAQWLTPTGLHNTVIRGETLRPEQLVAFCDHARRSFYLRPGYLMYKLLQVLRHPQELRRTLKSARTFVQHLLFGSDVGKKPVRGTK